MQWLGIASALGFRPERILQTLAHADPKMAFKIKTALVAGYSATQIANTLERSNGAAKKGGAMKSPAFRQREALAKSDVNDLLDPTRVLLTIGGGVAGGLLGGPIGAASGAHAGFEAGSDMLRKYRENLEAGGPQLGFSDYVSSLTKGAEKGLQTAGALKFISRVGALHEAPTGAPEGKHVSAIGPIKDKQDPMGGPSEPQGPMPSRPGGSPGNTPQAVSPTEVVSGGEQAKNLPAESKMDSMLPAEQTNQNAYDLMKRTRAGLFFPQLVERFGDPEKVISVLDKKYGTAWRKEISPKNPAIATEIAINAWKHIQSKTTEQPVDRAQPSNQQKPQKETAAFAENVQNTTQNSPELVENTGLERDSPEKVKDMQKAVAYATKMQKASEYLGTGEGKGVPIKNPKQVESLLSSNVRHLDYNPKDKKLQVLFAPSEGKKGGVYNYYDVPEQEVEKILGGEGTAKTVGANKFRAWFPGKNPSVGKALNNYLKRTNESGELVYPPHKLEESEINNQHVKSLRAADQVHKAIYEVDKFEDIFLKAQAKTRAEGLKMEMKALQDLDDDVLEDILLAVTKRMNAEVRGAKQAGKRKVYVGGGREAELKRRVISGVENVRSTPNATS